MSTKLSAPDPAVGPVSHHLKDRLYDSTKRALDVMLSATSLILLAPVLAIIAIWIKLESPGPVIFRQSRVGLHGRRFFFFKFRTMQSDTGSLESYLQHITSDRGRSSDLSSRVFKLESDPRLTRLGGVLRRTSLDELPSFFNVLKGDLSLVGPRPILPYEVHGFDERSLQRLNVKPGTTGLWQVYGATGDDWSFQKMIDMDLLYVTRRSLILDIKILAKTFWAVFSRQGGVLII